MKVKLFDKFKALGVAAVGTSLLAVPFIVPEAIPALPLALGGFLLSASYANKKLSGEQVEEINPEAEHAYSNQGISKEDAIESLLAMRRKAMVGINLGTKPSI